MADNSPESPTRPSLLLRLRDLGDERSWALFRDVYGPLVYRHCRRRGLQPADAEDVAQRVFRRVFRAIGGFEYCPERGRFRDWLGTLTRRELARHWASGQGRGGAGAGEAAEAPEAPERETGWAEECERHILQAALARARPHFGGPTWRAFQLTWLQGRPAEEAAAELGRDVAWVYRAKSRVLRRLQQEVRELADDTGLFSN